MGNGILGTTASMEQGTSWETYCEELWDDTDLNSEGSVRTSGIEFVSQAMYGFISMDFNHLAGNTKAFNWVSPDVQVGGPAHAFDWGAIAQSMVIAESCCNLRLFDQAYTIVAACVELLDHNSNPRPNTHLRLATLRIIAECKWQQPVSYRDKLWSPEWMWAEYERMYERVMTVLTVDPQMDKDGTTVESLETTAFTMLKMAALFLPDQLPEMVSDFNSRWDASLAVEDGHFLESDRCGEKARYYWDFEISKRWMGGSLTLEELDYCHARLIHAVHTEFKGDLKNYMLSLDLQYRFMAHSFTDLLEFPGG